MGWIGRGAAWMHDKAARIHKNFAKTRASVAVRFNAVPYSAQGGGGHKKSRPGAAVKGWPRRASGGHVDGVAALPFLAGGGVVDVGPGLDGAGKALFVAQAVPRLDAGEGHVLALRRP